MASLKDVSKHAGVNISTVSRYLSKKLIVKKETEERILRAVRELDYRPNSIARALKMRRTKIVGVIVPSSRNPLFAEIVGGIYSVLSKNGYAYIQTASENDIEREKECFKLLQEKQVDGLIVIGSAKQDHYDQWLQEGTILSSPVVFINRMFDKNDGRVRVLNDFMRGSYKATEYFIKSGRKKIAMLSGIPQLEESEIKERGYHQCLQDHGLPDDPELVRPGFFVYEEGFKAAQYLLKNKQPDAILAVNDLSAIAVISCAAQMGLSVPGDLAVIGYGNSEASSFTSPALSTIDQQKHFTGQRGAQLLLDMLNGRLSISELIKTELIIRSSC